MKNTVAEQWALFEKLVIHKDAPAIRHRQMQLAFYAGAEALLRLQYGMKDMSEDASVAMLQGWLDEVQQFGLQLWSEVDRSTGSR